MRHTVEQRALRYQRRYTGPWVSRAVPLGPWEMPYRVRRRRRIEWVRMDVAWHDLWTHAIGRGPRPR